MTPQELQIKVAELCGWKIRRYTYCEEQWIELRSPTKRVWNTEERFLESAVDAINLPPYTTSLDAIQQAAREMFKTVSEQDTFQTFIAFCSLNRMLFVWQLTPLDWCGAFVATCEELNQTELNQTKPNKTNEN